MIYFAFASAQSPRVLTNITKNCLATFETDGKSKMASLASGEQTELFRTFETGKTYKVLVLNLNTFESLNYTAYDDSNHILYDNKDTLQCAGWVYEPEKSIYVKLLINAPVNDIGTDIIFIVGSKRQKKK